jgi:hypothetical protein
VAAAAPTIRRLAPSATASRWALVAGGCVVLAALSLLIIAQTTYDPTAWLIWGREIVHGDLSTRAGPSWKPLPVLVATPAALLGDTGQMVVWLVIARAGVLAAIVLTYRLAWRLEGAIAGVLAAGALLVSSGFTSRTFRGDSEGLLLAVVFGAIEAHLCGRRRVTFALLVVATLLRPELSLFAVAYGLWLVRAAPSARVRRRTFAVAAGAGVAVVAAWLVPEKIGSGELFRAASRALLPVEGSPATADFPFVATFTNAAPVLPWPLYAAGIAYVVLAVRDRRRLAVALAVLATVVMVVIAAMAQAGFTGNIRYLTIPIALTGIVGAAGLGRLARLAQARLAPRRATASIVAAAAISLPFAGLAVARTADQMRGGLHESQQQAAIPDAVARAGGRAAVLRCGPVATKWYDVQAVARALHVHEFEVGLRPVVPGTIMARRGASLLNDRRFRVRTATSRWVVASSCGG